MCRRFCVILRVRRILMRILLHEIFLKSIKIYLKPTNEWEKRSGGKVLQVFLLKLTCFRVCKGGKLSFKMYRSRMPNFVSFYQLIFDRGKCFSSLLFTLAFYTWTDFSSKCQIIGDSEGYVFACHFRSKKSTYHMYIELFHIQNFLDNKVQSVFYIIYFFFFRKVWEPSFAEQYSLSKLRIIHNGYVHLWLTRNRLPKKHSLSFGCNYCLILYLLVGIGIDKSLAVLFLKLLAKKS